MLYFTYTTHCLIIFHNKNKNMDILNRFGMINGLLTLLFITFCPRFINGCSYYGAKEITIKYPIEKFTTKFADIDDKTKKDGKENLIKWDSEKRINISRH